MSCSQDQRVSITEKLITGLLPNSIVSLQGGGLRWLDAWEVPQEDFNVVTRPAQFNDTQNWRLTLVPRASGDIPVFTVVQVSSGRFLDAHEIPQLYYRVVTRPQQNNDTQLWRFFDYGGGFYTIQQVSSGRFLQATLDGDFQVVTVPDENEPQVTWRLGAPAWSE
jgi:Ricin-type beta-trefoil lectin domain-like